MGNSMISFILLIFALIGFGVIISVSMIGSMDKNISYAALYDRCLIRPDCCKLSVDHMRENGFFEAKDMQCPEGYRINDLDCPGTLYWCEKIDN